VVSQRNVCPKTEKERGGNERAEGGAGGRDWQGYYLLRYDGELLLTTTRSIENNKERNNKNKKNNNNKKKKGGEEKGMVGSVRLMVVRLVVW
jgi:hypothetical protein